MRKKKRIYKEGDLRIVRRFLLFPVSVWVDDSTKERRWWEWAYLLQKYECGCGLCDCDCGWSTQKFLDTPEDFELYNSYGRLKEASTNR